MSTKCFKEKLIQLVIPVVTVSFICGCVSRQNTMQDRINLQKQRIVQSVRLNNYLFDRNFEAAWCLLDSLEKYDDFPWTLYVKGWIYDIKGDNKMAVKFYTESQALYKYYNTLHDYDYMNQIMLTLCLNGREAARAHVDSLITSYKAQIHNLESVKVVCIDDSLFNKECIFPEGGRAQFEFVRE